MRSTCRRNSRSVKDPVNAHKLANFLGSLEKCGGHPALPGLETDQWTGDAEGSDDPPPLPADRGGHGSRPGRGFLQAERQPAVSHLIELCSQGRNVDGWMTFITGIRMLEHLRDVLGVQERQEGLAGCSCVQWIRVSDPGSHP